MPCTERVRSNARASTGYPAIGKEEMAGLQGDPAQPRAERRGLRRVGARHGSRPVEVSGLDQRTHALVRLGAALAVDAAPSSYQSTIDMAFAAGASIDEIVGTLIAVAPTVGLARVVSAAPELALALGYDLETAFETSERATQ